MPKQISAAAAFLESDDTEKNTRKTDAIDYLKRRGIDVRFPGKNGQILTGKLVDVSRPESFVVVYLRGDEVTIKEFDADQLYLLNPTLQDIVEPEEQFAPPNLEQLLDVSRRRYTSVLEDMRKPREEEDSRRKAA